MPRSKKGRGRPGNKRRVKAKNGKRKKPVADGLKPSFMSSGQLLGFIKRLQVEQRREMEERNLFMLEKSKLWSLWELSMQKYKLLGSIAVRTEVGMLQAEEEKEKEKALKDQQLRMVLNEEVKNFGTIRLAHLYSMARASDSIWEIEIVLRESVLDKKHRFRRSLQNYFDLLRSLRKQHTRQIAEMLQALGDAIRTYEQRYESAFFTHVDLWDESSPTKGSLYVRESEDRYIKLDKVQVMKEDHITSMRTYFNGVIANNINLMSILRAQVDTALIQYRHIKRQLESKKSTYLELHNTLEQLVKDIEFRKSQMKRTEMPILLEKFREYETKSAELRREIKYANVRNEVLLQQYDIAKEERDDAKNAFSKVCQKMQRVAHMNRFVVDIKTKSAHQDAIFLESYLKFKRHRFTPFQSVPVQAKLQNEKVEKYQDCLKDHLNCYRSSMSGRITESFLENRKCLRLHDESERRAMGHVKRDSRVIKAPWERFNNSRKDPFPPGTRHKEILTCQCVLRNTTRKRDSGVKLNGFRRCGI